MGMGWGWGLDARFVLRTMRRSPGYAVTSVLVLACAVAVNAAVFSFVRGTLLAKPAYPDADRVVVAWGSNAADGQLRDVVSGANYLDLARGMTSLEALGAFHTVGSSILHDGHPEVVAANDVSVDFFQAVPVKAYLGRVFDGRDRMSGGEATVVVSYAFWRDRLGADPSAIGRSLLVDGEPLTVIGVLPEDFEFVGPVPLWRPLYDDVLAGEDRSFINYNLIGRLRPGVTPAEATRDLSSVMDRIVQEHPRYEGWSILVEQLHQASVMAVRPALLSITAAVALVLLVALVNLATLFRIRSLGRADELGVRLALGGGRGRVARILVMEAAGLALAGSVVGMLVAPALLARVRAMIPVYVNIPDSAARVPVVQAVLSPAVVSVTIAMVVLGALALTAPGLVAALRTGDAAWGGRRATRSRGMRWLVTIELALATVLCLGAGLTTRSADKLLKTDVGVRDAGLLGVNFGDVWDRPRDEQVAYFRQVREAVQEVPGVTSAGIIDYIPFRGEDDYAGVTFLDRAMQPTEHLREQWRRVSDGLFETAGMRILQGRGFTADDFQGKARVTVVNAAFAAKHFQDRSPVGAFVSTHDDAYRELEIVGVVADVRAAGPASPAPAMLYVPIQGDPRGTAGIYVRVARGDPMAVASRVRDAIWSVDPSQPVEMLGPIADLVGSWVAIPRATRTLVSGLAVLSLLLAAVGVFGVVAYAVRSRTRELGVRVALGASPDRLRRDLLAATTPMVLLGVGAGLVAGVSAARAAESILFGVAPMDPVSVVAAAAAMTAAALLATWLPARRASRIDPTEAIRAE